MATSYLHEASPLAHSRLHSTPTTIGTPPYHTDVAVENRVRGTGRADPRVAAPQDTSTFYKKYLDTNVTLLGDQEYLELDNEKHLCDSQPAAAHNVSIDDAQLQARGHTAAYKLAIRLANRSNGAPLATIIEQGSHSTLNSHGSLLGVGRFPSIKTAQSASPNRGSRRRSRSLDEMALHDIQEDRVRELDASAVAVPPPRLKEEHGAATPASGTATPLTSYRFELQQSPSPLFGEEIYDVDNRGVKGFIRGVFQSVLGASRTRSRSSSMTHAPIMDHRESPPSAPESTPQAEQQCQEPDRAYMASHSCDVSTRAPESVAMVPIPGHQPGMRATSSLGTKLSARAPLTLTASRILTPESTTLFGSLTPTLPYRTTTRSHEKPFSIPIEHAGTRDVAQVNGTIQASMLHHDMFDTTARNTFDGVPVYREQPTSTNEASIASARDVFTSQNASFCSTMTSSYSGTVLGVDLDLQHGSSRSIRRSQSPPTPVWFTPQMSELERQASCPDSPQSVEAFSPSQDRSRSITSSALTSLLPIAAASGIVRPNYNTPKISFYSPSGNLIQPESSSTQGTSPSDHDGSPTIASSNYFRQSTNGASPSRSLPILPPLVHMITPPIHETPLPSHLTYHHNYGRSEVGSRESFVTPKGPVKGCGGVVRENSLTPRSGIFFAHSKVKVHRSARLAVNDLKAEMKFYRGRFLTLTAAHSFAPSISRGKTLQKRHVHIYNTYATQPHLHEEAARKGGYIQDVLGPLTPHALRVCFCQPYDGAGRPTHATAPGTCMTDEIHPKGGRAKVNQHLKDSDHMLPNARIVSNKRRIDGGNTKRAARRDSAVSSTTGRVSNAFRSRRKTECGLRISQVPYLGTLPDCSYGGKGHAGPVV